MKVKYKGAGSLEYHSVPSQHSYVFFSNVYQEVLSEDEQFFRNKAANPNNPWEVETISEKVEAIAEKIHKKTWKGGSKKGADE